MAEQKSGGGQSVLEQIKEMGRKTPIPMMGGMASFGTTKRNRAALDALEMFKDAIKRKRDLKTGAKVLTKDIMKKAKQDLRKGESGFNLIKSAPDRLTISIPRFRDEGFRTAGSFKRAVVREMTDLKKFVKTKLSKLAKPLRKKTRTAGPTSGGETSQAIKKRLTPGGLTDTEIAKSARKEFGK